MNGSRPSSEEERKKSSVSGDQEGNEEEQSRGSMYGTYNAPTFTIKNQPNVGKIYQSPMDPMGNGNWAVLIVMSTHERFWMTISRS